MAELLGLEIAGWAFTVPERVVTNADLERDYGVSAEWIQRVSGIQRRHVVDPMTGPTDLSIPAAKRALERANLAPEDLDLVVLATIQSDYTSPSGACLIQAGIGATRAAAFDVNCACLGFVWAMQIAASFLHTGVYRNALVIGADTCTRGLDYKDPSTFILMGDGAGAVVLKARPGAGTGILAQEFRSDGTKWEVATLKGGGSKFPDARLIPEEKLGDYWFRMDGHTVFRFAVTAMNQTMTELMAQAGVAREDIALIVPHQANVRILEAAMKRAEVPLEKCFVDMQEYGNVGSASCAIALVDALEQGKIAPGDKVLLVAFGAGLTWGGMLLQL